MLQSLWQPWIFKQWETELRSRQKWVLPCSSWGEGQAAQLAPPQLPSECTSQQLVWRQEGTGEAPSIPICRSCVQSHAIIIIITANKILYGFLEKNDRHYRWFPSPLLYAYWLSHLSYTNVCQRSHLQGIIISDFLLPNLQPFSIACHSYSSALRGKLWLIYISLWINKNKRGFYISCNDLRAFGFHFPQSWKWRNSTETAVKQ